MIHHSRSTFNEVSSCKAMEIQVLKGLHPSSRNHPIVYRSTLMSQFPSSTKTIRRLLPIQWPQPHNEEICLAMEEAEFEEKLSKKEMAMEIATPAPAPITSPKINITLSPAKTETHKKNMIQVSNTKKPLFFDVNLAKREIGLVDLVLIPERSLAFICPPKCLFVFQIEQFEKVSESICVICIAFDAEHGLVSLFFVYFTFNCFNLHTTIMMVVTISENLKNTGLTTDKKVLTSTVGMKDEAKGKMIEIVLGKSDKFDSLVPPVTNGKTP
ncbi:hypothetical protein HID58_051833 [Brassica napus]|uniref:Uncharacterized protein n=2 Tax=Brassica TaxID=3705 RepID=A0ABQ8AAA8_BRANA|nr:hypothetical protein HID58_051833 [Brassica napus]